MKHKIFNISLALLFLTLFSCKKDMPDTQLLNAEIETPMLSEMDQYLLEFKQKMDNPLKSGELMSLEDARWHLSATLNFSYADTKMEYEILPLDTVFVNVPLQSGQVSMEAFSNAFFEITGFLSARYHEIEAAEKTLDLVSVSISGQANDQAELMAVAMMGYNSGLSWGYPFSEGHWWYWGWGLGRCGPYEGENIGSDAAKRLTFAANITVPVPGPGRVYWTDEYTAVVHADYFPDEMSPSGYKLFASHIPIDYLDPNFQHSCLPPDDLNYYHPNILEFGVINEPPGLSLIKYHVIDDILMYNYQSFPRHTLMIYYGIPHISGQPQEDL